LIGEIKDLGKQENLGEDHIDFLFHGKLVLCGEDNKIYRVEAKDEVYRRLAARKAAAHWGINQDLFCEEKIIEETSYYVITV